MSVIDLKKRVTSDWREMHQHLQSTDSFIYVSPRKKAKIGPVSMDVEVGDTYILPGSNEVFKIPSEGVKIKPGNSIVVYTHQNFKLPYNVFGIVTGKGQYIFKGCFLSTGKIDPGFEGCLKIGFFNGGCSRIILKPNEVFATVFFYEYRCNTVFTFKELSKQFRVRHQKHQMARTNEVICKRAREFIAHVVYRCRTNGFILCHTNY